MDQVFSRGQLVSFAAFPEPAEGPVADRLFFKACRMERILEAEVEFAGLPDLVIGHSGEFLQDQGSNDDIDRRIRTRIRLFAIKRREDVFIDMRENMRGKSLRPGIFQHPAFPLRKEAKGIKKRELLMIIRDKRHDEIPRRYGFKILLLYPFSRIKSRFSGDLCFKIVFSCQGTENGCYNVNEVSFSTFDTRIIISFSGISFPTFLALCTLFQTVSPKIFTVFRSCPFSKDYVAAAMSAKHPTIRMTGTQNIARPNTVTARPARISQAAIPKINPSIFPTM